MVKRVHGVHARAALVFDQMRSAEALIDAHPGPISLDEFHAENPYFDLLDRLYGEDYRLAELLDASDLTVHAEGPGAADHAPRLDVITWLCTSVGKHLRALLAATGELAQASPAVLRHAFDLRLTGMAPGSLYLGFAVSPPPPGKLDTVAEQIDTALEAAREAVRALPLVARYVGDTEVGAGLIEEMPDAALRDASLMAAYRLSPTGKKGIHTLEITARGDDGRGVLDTRDRVVLRETVLHRPLMRAAHSTTLQGEIREIDLDAQRFKLRTDEGVVRCAFGFEVKHARQVLGGAVRVSGLVEADRDGRPRLMRAERIEALARQLPLT